MRKEDLNPAAYTRQIADLRLLKQEARGINQRIKEGRRRKLEEYRELGKRLKAIKEVTKHGDWLPLLEELGITTQRASEAVIVSDGFWMFPEAAGVKELVEFLAGVKGSNRQSKITEQGQTQTPASGSLTETESGQQVTENGKTTTSQEPPAAGQGEVSVREPEPGPAVGSATSVGDAAEDLPPGAILDPEGNVLPPSVADALEGASGAEEAREHLRAAVRAVKSFAETPAGVYVDAKHITTRITAAVRQLNCHVLTVENTFRCDGVPGHGCAGASCAKCKGRGFIPKPLIGDQGPKPKKKPYYGGRRR